MTAVVKGCELTQVDSIPTHTATDDVDQVHAVYHHQLYYQCETEAWQAHRVKFQLNNSTNQGVCKSSPNFQISRFPRYIKPSSRRIFTLIESPKYYNVGYKHMHFQLCTTLWIKLHKNGQWQFGCKDVIRFGSVIGILSYCSRHIIFSRSINKISGNFQHSQEWFQIPGDMRSFVSGLNLNILFCQCDFNL